ncbi:MAG: autotransporter-associated beta strand repeat-containing protein, partial [Candidatus Nealsonbacteria bacterium]|nr:autotransporter-associated beta strand repeat-containing protein [Candidatus Nealsonbacteria bacterium]
MRNKTVSTIVAVALVAMLALSTNIARAADLTWGGGDGVWNTSTANWGGSTFTDGGVDNVTFNNLAGGTITIDPLMTPLSTTVNTAEGTTYTFVERDFNSVDHMIDGGTLVKDGPGTLALGLGGDNGLPPWGSNAFSNGFSAVSVNAGTLIYRGRQAFGPVDDPNTPEVEPTTTVTMAGGTTLIQDRQEGNGPQVAVLNPFVLSGGNVNVEVYWGNKDIWLSGAISGNGGFNVSGGGRGFTLGGDNSFTGGVVVQNSDARFMINHHNALGTGTLTWEQSNAGWQGFRATADLRANDTYPDGVPNDVAIGQDAIFAVHGDGNMELSGVISGDTGSLIKRHAGILILSGDNTYAGGTIVQSGTLTVDGSLADSTMTIDNGPPGGHGTTTPGVVDGSGTLNFNIDGATSDLIEVINGGTLDITELNIAFSEVGSGFTEPVYVLVDYGVVDVDPGILIGTEFASVTGAAAGYEIDYDYLGGGNQIALVASLEMIWDGGDFDWAAAKWNTGDTPIANAPMIIEAAGSIVTVAENFTSGERGPAASVTLGETGTASLIVNDDKTLEVIGDVAVGPDGTLQVDGTLTAASATVAGTLAGSGTINVDVDSSTEVTGIVAPGPIVSGVSGIGTLTLGNGEMGLDPTASFNAQVSLAVVNSVQPDKSTKLATDQIVLSDENVALQIGGTLAISSLGDRTDAGYWAASPVIIDNAQRGVIGVTGTPPYTGREFNAVTPAPPASGEPALHLGQGLFLRPGAGVTYVRPG